MASESYLTTNYSYVCRMNYLSSRKQATSASLWKRLFSISGFHRVNAMPMLIRVFAVFCHACVYFLRVSASWMTGIHCPLLFVLVQCMYDPHLSKLCQSRFTTLNGLPAITRVYPPRLLPCLRCGVYVRSPWASQDSLLVSFFSALRCRKRRRMMISRSRPDRM